MGDDARRVHPPGLPGLRLVLPILAFGAAAARADVAGVATVRDADSLEIHGRQIRLYGVDAPEGRQLCERGRAAWRCGAEAARALAGRLGRRSVTCQERDRDRYGRTVAVCRLGDDDLGAWLVREGWALAYRRYTSDYVDEEAAARTARRGIWGGTFLPPWDWRQRERARVSTSPAPPPGDCRIKGNRGQRGRRIYHLPGDPDYAATRIDTTRGERWFCSEDEARTAGWRRAR